MQGVRSLSFHDLVLSVRQGEKGEPHDHAQTVRVMRCNSVSSHRFGNSRPTFTLLLFWTFIRNECTLALPAAGRYRGGFPDFPFRSFRPHIFAPISLDVQCLKTSVGRLCYCGTITTALSALHQYYLSLKIPCWNSRNAQAHLTNLHRSGSHIPFEGK